MDSLDEAKLISFVYDINGKPWINVDHLFFVSKEQLININSIMFTKLRLHKCGNTQLQKHRLPNGCGNIVLQNDTRIKTYNKTSMIEVREAIILLKNSCMKGSLDLLLGLHDFFIFNGPQIESLRVINHEESLDDRQIKKRRRRSC